MTEPGVHFDVNRQALMEFFQHHGPPWLAVQALVWEGGPDSPTGRWEGVEPDGTRWTHSTDALWRLWPPPLTGFRAGEEFYRDA